ncbi:MAG: fasciclin domain-containing protein [Candidatus Paceibacterota bacterium]
MNTKTMIIILVFAALLVAGVVFLAPSSELKRDMSTEIPNQGETPREEYRAQFSSDTDFISNIKRADNLTIFARMLDKVASEAIGGTGPFTVFAPTDEALGEMDEVSDAALIEFVRNHVVAGSTILFSCKTAPRLKPSGTTRSRLLGKDHASKLTTEYSSSNQTSNPPTESFMWLMGDWLILNNL